MCDRLSVSIILSRAATTPSAYIFLSLSVSDESNCEGRKSIVIRSRSLVPRKPLWLPRLKTPNGLPGGMAE